MENIKIKGLMTIPPICDSEAEVSKYFESMYQTFIDIKNKNIDNVKLVILMLFLIIFIPSYLLSSLNLLILPALTIFIYLKTKAESDGYRSILYRIAD